MKSHFLFVYKNKIPLLIGSFVLIIYLPYLVKGGFIVDDWGVVYNSTVTSSFGAGIPVGFLFSQTGHWRLCSLLFFHKSSAKQLSAISWLICFFGPARYS